jgi:hypothetical protein
MKTLPHICLLFLFIGAQNGLARTITVHSAADSGPGSLRQALVDAANGDTININAKLTIYLTSGELVVGKNLMIKGPGANGPTISGNNTSRVFHIMPGTTVTIDDIAITNGQASPDINDFPANAGGGIYNDHARLTVSNCTLSGNSATLGGGTFSNSMDGGSATLTISNTTLSNNSAGLAGGGIFSGGGFYDGAPAGSASLVVSNSAITNNSAAVYGGGIFTDGLAGNATLTVTKSVLNGNSAGSGGGIYNNGDSGASEVTITNCKLSNNSASFDPQNPTTPPGGIGSAIFNDGSASLSPGNATLAVTGSTFSNNAASFPVTIFNYGLGGSATMTLTNCAITNNTGIVENVGAIATVRNCTIDGNVGGGIGNFGFSPSEPGFTGSATLTVINSAVINNAGGDTGGIRNSGGSAILMVVDSFITGNSDGLGGGVSNEFGYAALTNTTVSGNTANSGGGISVYSGGTVILNNCTISGNSAGYGGAIFIQSRSTVTGAFVSLTNCTVSGNTVTGNAPAIVNQSAEGVAALILNNDTITGNGGVGAYDGIFNWSIDPTLGNATLDIANTIIGPGASYSIANLDGTVTSHGYNICIDTGYPVDLLNGPGDLLNTNPMLGPLKDNGGPTMTHALLDHSPAINAGDPNFNPYLFNPPLLYDQRGGNFPRLVGGRVDIGAFEAKRH